MRGCVERFSEEPQEMKWRQAGFAGNLVQIERQVIPLVDKPPCANEPLIGFGRNRGLFRICEDLVLHHQAVSDAAVFLPPSLPAERRFVSNWSPSASSDGEYTT